MIPGKGAAASSQEMLDAYPAYGIFAHEDPVRAAVRRIADLRPEWIRAMHGATVFRPAPVLTRGR